MRQKALRGENEKEEEEGNERVEIFADVQVQPQLQSDRNTYKHIQKHKCMRSHTHKHAHNYIPTHTHTSKYAHTQIYIPIQKSTQTHKVSPYIYIQRRVGGVGDGDQDQNVSSCIAPLCIIYPFHLYYPDLSPGRYKQSYLTFSE